MEDFLRYLISPLLGNPDLLRISITPSSASIKVAPEDAGRIIGRHGQVINSLRTILKSYCALHQVPPAYLHLEVPPVTTTVQATENIAPVFLSRRKASPQNH